MANSRISDLTLASVVAGANMLEINEAGTSKRIDVDLLVAYLRSIGAAPYVAALTSGHAISSTTATEVTGLQISLPASGRYRVYYELICQSSAVGTGLKLGINYTGTVASMAARMILGTTGTTAATGIADGTIATLTGNVVEHSSAITESTTAPNLGPFTGVASANQDFLLSIAAMVVVSDAGDLELWHGSEGAVSTTVMAGSGVEVLRLG